MILLLRKRHLQAWMILSFLLPAGILIAWFSVPEQLINKSLQPAAVTSLVKVLKESGNTIYHLKLRSNESGDALQLEIQNTTALEYPSALVYLLSSDQNTTGNQVPPGAELLGRIQERGIYNFQLKNEYRNNRFTILLYDIIHHQRIDTLKF